MIGELPDSQGQASQINNLREGVTQMPVGVALQELRPGP